MKILWFLLIVPLSIFFLILYNLYREWRNQKDLEKGWEIRDRIKEIRGEVEEEMKGKSPEEKAKVFNEKMKRFRNEG